MNVSPTKILCVALVAIPLVFPRTTTLAQEPSVPTPSVLDTKPFNYPNPKDDTENREDISIGELEAIDVESIGLLAEGDGGLGADLWNRSDRHQVEMLVSQIPTKIRSRAGHNLLKLLVLSSTRPPKKNGNSLDFLQVRLKVLVDLGEFESFVELLSKVPDNAITEDIKKLNTDVLLLMGDIETGCKVVDSQVQHGESLYWQKALFICQLMNGETARAALTLSLLREQNDDLDTGFLELGSLSLGEISALSTALTPNALNFALLLGTEEHIPEHWLLHAGPAIQRAIAESATIPLATRLVAAEHAAEMGAFSATDVGRLYRLMKFNEDELDNAITVAERMGGAMGRALLHQASRQKQKFEQRAALLLASWGNSLTTGNVILAALVNNESFLTLPIDNQIAYGAPQISRALLASGSTEEFQLWLNFIDESAEIDAIFDNVLSSLMPLVVITKVDTARSWYPQLAERWWNTIPISDTTGASRNLEQANRLFVILDALGYTISQSGWNLLLGGPTVVTTKVPSVSIRYSLNKAAKTKQLGSTILFCLLALGEGGPVEAGPLALGSVLRSLRHVGLENHAQALAFEALVENGL